MPNARGRSPPSSARERPARPRRWSRRAMDALVIATSTPGACSVAARLPLRAGLPAFCEKPVSLDLASLRRLIEEVERAGTFVQIGFQRRCDAGYRAARTRSPPARSAPCSCSVRRPMIPRRRRRHTSPPRAGSSATSHIHDFDAIRFVSGQEVVEVYAVGAVRETGGSIATGMWTPRSPRYASAAAPWRSDGHAPRPARLRRPARGLRHRGQRRSRRSTRAAAPLRRTRRRALRPSGYANFLDRFEAAYRNELAAFVSSVLAGGTSPCPLAEARAALAVALAAGRSRAERRPVSIEEVTSAQTAAG